MHPIIKYAITAFLVVGISELAKISDKLGAFIASLPMVTLLVLIWLYIDNQPTTKIANHAFYTFWYVIGSLPFFLIFPLLLNHFSFVLALFFSALLTFSIFFIYTVVMTYIGISL